MTAVEEMAAFAVNARGEGLTNTARLQLKIHVLDTLGCALTAVALIDRTVTPTQCAPRRVRRSDVQALLCRVTVRANADFSQRFPNEMPSRVSVTLHDGQVVTNELADYPGFHTRPQDWDDAVEKCSGLAVDRLPVSRLTEVAAAVHEVETIRVAELTALLRDTGKSGVAARMRRAV